MNIKPLLFLVLLLSIVSCSQDIEPEVEEPQVPLELTPKTMEGKGTLSFLANGEVWVADLVYGSFADIKENDNMLSFGNYYGNTDGYFCHFTLSDYMPNRYMTSDDFFINVWYGLYPDKMDLCNHDFTSTRDSFNQVTINHLSITDSISIISGTFQNKLKSFNNANCYDSIMITDGRFDLELDIL